MFKKIRNFLIKRKLISLIATVGLATGAHFATKSENKIDDVVVETAAEIILNSHDAEISE